MRITANIARMIFPVFIFVFLTFREVGAANFEIDLDPFWELFKKIFSKTYKDDEEVKRRATFEKNIKGVVMHNLKADLGFSSFRTGLNEYSDYTDEEFEKYLKGFKEDGRVYHKNSSRWIQPSNVKHPDSLDWRDEGLVTSVKDQGQCGCCWAFSSLGSLEGQHKKKSGDLISLSTQHLVDCATNDGCKGCDGGLMTSAFEYIKSSEGVNTENSYPFAEEQGECKYKPENLAATCTGYVELPSGDESALKDAVTTVGPISVAIDTKHGSFLIYKSGIYDEPLCSSSQIDHAVLLVGYGTEDDTDYWLIKNSWGESWGIKGYMKLARNRNNMCGIASKASYPLV